MSFDDLYNNFKIVEQEVKRTVSSSSNSSSQNMAFVSSPSSTNEVNTANIQVSTASTPITTASLNDNNANLSDATVYAFLANQPNRSQLVHEDLEQIHEDDLEEMDLKWQLALLSMRARKYYQRTGKKITINRSDTAGYDKSKVECFNCHKMGHFSRECRSQRHQESRPRNQDSSRKTVNVEETSSKVMVAIDGAGIDWSFMADEEVHTNMALMAFSDSELNKSKFDLANYKRGLASIEEQLVFYKKNEVVFCDQIAVLKRDASYRDLEIIALNTQVENLKKEKESNKIKIDSFENASKSLDKLIGSQISNNNRKGVGFESYNAVAPPPTGLFAPPTIDLSNSGLEEFQKPKFEGYGLNVNKCVSENSSNVTKKTTSAPIIEEWFSDSDEDECEVKESEKYCDFHDKKMVQKPVLNNKQKGTGPREVRSVWKNALRTNHQNFSNSRRNFAPTAVLTKSGLVPTNIARQSSLRVAVPVSTARPINTAAPKTFVNVAKPRPNAFQKSHSPSRRLVYQQTTLKNIYLSNKVNTTKVNFVNTTEGKKVISAVGKQGSNSVKSSTCWVWRPTGKVIDHGDPQAALKDTSILDSGCSRHMTGNKSYLTDYKDYDGGFVAFAGSSKGGKITGKGKIRTGKLDFEDVYFVKELKFNLFSVSQMCDRKNSVLFTDLNVILLEVLPSKIFENDYTCVACQKGKQHKATCNSKLLNSVCQPLQILHMDLFGPTFVKSIMGKMYCLVVTDETCGILKDFITGIENQLDHKVKIIKCDNGTEFKNYEMNQLCRIKGIKREFSNARTPQQNGVAERKNRTLIEAARTMLADSLLPITFWAEAVNTACYVQNRVLVTKPHNKTPYELLIGRTPIIGFMGPFGFLITILNTLDHLGKFDGKADEGFLVGYSINNQAFRVYNSRNRKVEENLHVNFLENKPNVVGIGPKWLFDIDSLTNSMNYQPVNTGNRTNDYAGTETNSNAGQDGKEKVPDQEYILLPLLHNSSYVPSRDKADDLGSFEQQVKFGDDAKNINSTNSFNTVSLTVNTAGVKSGNLQSIFDELAISKPILVNTPSSSLGDLNALENTGIFDDAYDDRDEGAEANYNNLETKMLVSPIPSTRANKDHPKEQIIRAVHSAIQTRKMIKQSEAGLITFINKQRRTNHKDLQNCLFACFLSQMEPKKVTQALDDESWVEAMQEELLQFKILNVWTLVNLPYSKKVIGTKQEEGIDYDEVFVPVARIEAIRLFLAYASFMGFPVYQIDVKSAFLYGAIEEEVYVSQPPGFVDPEFPDKVYKVKKALYGLHQAPRAWYETLSTYLMENGFRRGTIDKNLFIKKIKNNILLVQVYVDDIIFRSTNKSLSTKFEQLMHKRFQMSSMRELTCFLGLQVKQRKDGIFLSQDKYVGDILQKFGFSNVKSTSTPMETHKPLSKDADGTDADVYLYKSMIGYLMYLTSSRPDIIYLKGQPTLGLCYPKDSPLDLIAYFDSDYAGASLDRKSTTRGCQFLGYRLISWQCKKQTFVANSTTEAENIATSNCCGQVLWLQNQLLDYGYNFMQTKIHVENESAICVVKNHVYHSKTKHVEIRHHFIRDSYEKKLIEMVKIHTYYNVVDLLTKAFDVARFQFLIASIGQTATGKESSNPLMVGSLPKTILPTKVKDQHSNVESPNTPSASLIYLKTHYISTTSIQEQPSQAPIIEPIPKPTTSSPHLHDTIIPQTPPHMPHDSPLPGGHIPGSVEGSMSLNELTDLCTKLFDKVTNLKKDLKQTKQLYGKAITKLVKKVKLLEDKLKSTTERRKTRMVLSDDEEELNIEDTFKQGRMKEIVIEDVKFTEFTPTKATQGEEQSQDSSDAHLGDLSAAKILVDASRERVKTYTRRKRSTDSSRVSTAVEIFSTAEDVHAKEKFSTDEHIAQKLHDEEKARAGGGGGSAREEQEGLILKKP
ncbi:putative ribonuclease H-like domain-containing protein [Tanacetum coccineum]